MLCLFYGMGELRATKPNTVIVFAKVASLHDFIEKNLLSFVFVRISTTLVFSRGNAQPWLSVRIQPPMDKI